MLLCHVTEPAGNGTTHHWHRWSWLNWYSNCHS